MYYQMNLVGTKLAVNNLLQAKNEKIVQGSSRFKEIMLSMFDIRDRKFYVNEAGTNIYPLTDLDTKQKQRVSELLQMVGEFKKPNDEINEVVQEEWEIEREQMDASIEKGSREEMRGMMEGIKSSLKKRKQEKMSHESSSLSSVIVLRELDKKKETNGNQNNNMTSENIQE